MCTLVMVNEPYKSIESVPHLIDYVTRDKDRRLLSFIGVLNGNLYHLSEEMLKIKQYFRKETGKQIRHFIVSFEGNTIFNAYDAYILGFQIAAYYADRYQIVFGVHEDTDNLHIHFAFNSVSFVDGIKYSGGVADMYRLKAYISGLIKGLEIDLETLP